MSNVAPAQGVHQSNRQECRNEFSEFNMVWPAQAGFAFHIRGLQSDGSRGIADLMLNLHQPDGSCGIADYSGSQIR